MTGNWCPSKLPFWRCAEGIRPSQNEWRRQRGQAARYRTQNQSRRASCHTYGYDAVSPSTRGGVWCKPLSTSWRSSHMYPSKRDMDMSGPTLERGKFVPVTLEEIEFRWCEAGLWCRGSVRVYLWKLWGSMSTQTIFVFLRILVVLQASSLCLVDMRRGGIDDRPSLPMPKSISPRL